MRTPLDDLSPLFESAVELVVERLVDQLVDDPFDLVALEYEDDVGRRDVDAVSDDPAVREIERWAGADEVDSALFASFS